MREALEKWVSGASIVGHDGTRLPENAIRIRDLPTGFRQLAPGDSRPMTLTQEDGATPVAWFTGQLEYGFDYIDDRTYIGNFGKAVASQHLAVIGHELGHTIGGFRNNLDYDPTTGSVSGDVAGDTVRFQTVIHEELCFPARNAYLGQSTDLIAGFACTNGQEIDRTITSNWNIFLPQPDTQRYLMINTGDGGRRLAASEGDDRLYGMGGNDILVGAGGRDFLDGGTGDDPPNGGAGSVRREPTVLSIFDLCGVAEWPWAEQPE